MSINRSKRSLTLNLKHPEALKTLQRLIETADVLVENFRPGTMESFGFGYDTVQQLNPRLIFCSISGFGHTGPKSDLPGYDLIIQGEGGVASLTGDPNGPHTRRQLPGRYRRRDDGLSGHFTRTARAEPIWCARKSTSVCSTARSPC
jgi:crotonobetainyl-CoA:carnitine CoA-transferase CaiB-like acyl-CoA transferase